MKEKKYKESYYNNYVNQEGIVLYYNTLYDSYLVVKNFLNKIFIDNINTLENIEAKEPEFFKMLLDNFFIVPNEVDEKILYQNILLKRKFSSKTYELIINPTFDCNLNCWYCYETHVPNSKMQPEIIDRLIKHLEVKFDESKYDELLLSFFGGEPLIRGESVIIPILERAYSFAKRSGIKVRVHFTTNGTVIQKEILKILKKFNVSFQVTVDGFKNTHDKVRAFKNTGEGSYEQILENIQKIIKSLSEYKINVRINYDSETLLKARQVVDDLSKLKSEKLIISLHRIWQVDAKDIEYSSIFDFITYAHDKGIMVDYLPLQPQSYVCYADNYNQAIINYDGLVYKCTARDFTKDGSEGELLEDGRIDWKTKKLMTRLNVSLPKICVDCKLLPSCCGICSQKRLEEKEYCFIDSKLSIDDYIIYNFNRHHMLKKNKISSWRKEVY